MKPVILRQIAEQDIDKGFTHYLENAGVVIAMDFITAIDGAIHHIESLPGTGSPRYGELLNANGLRSWMTSTFPYTLFYIERTEDIDVLRVLHQHADIPAQIQLDLPENSSGQ